MGKSRRFVKTILILGLMGVFGSKESLASEKLATIVNPVRSRELWKDKTLKPIEDQYKIINELDLKATWLVQNDAVRDKELTATIKQFDQKHEVGIFLEVSQELAKRARVYYPINRPWYSPEAVLLSGYSRDDRVKLIDRIMKDFKDTFDYWPKSVGAWWIDSYSFEYLEKRYGIKTAMIVADQRTTDNYGVWGQWWGYPYYPAKENILAPGNSKVLIIQWALRDPEMAYLGEGPKTSNYSLQANDYISQGLDIKYFEKLASIYFDKRNILGQITVGLETGMESEGFMDEYKKQVEWIKNNHITGVTMTEMENKYRQVYGENPSEVRIGEWLMTPNFRENKKLGDRVDYIKGVVFGDYYEKDTSTFLNRIYTKDNLVNGGRFPYLELALILVTGGCLYFKINWIAMGGGILGLKMMEHLRYSMVNGEKLIGFLIDNFRFVGVTDKIRFINGDLSNLVAQSMLKMEIKEIYYLIWLLICLLVGVVYGRYIKTKKN